MRKTALTIAGSDCSGGAGIQADIKTMMANGVYAMSAITAMTAQNTTGVYAIRESSPEFLAQQLDCVFSDIYPDAVKVGMVSSEALIRVVADRLSFYKAKNIVVDPVMVSTSGSPLLRETALDAMKHSLFGLADLLTPNIPEAEILCGQHITTAEQMREAAQRIGETYGCSVLLKGGHSLHDADDMLYRIPAPGDTNCKPATGDVNRDSVPGTAAWESTHCTMQKNDGSSATGGSATAVCLWFHGTRIDNPNTHGTGCTLSSAIAANLAKGYDMEASIRRAKDYLTGALSAMLDLGAGSGPVDHGFQYTEEKSCPDF
ncbi:MAG: bifunctional hydroxymethylpyrimidine kinase/phosphomethylpyrimidine kinase [Lachnospiraceae bacterium]|nr:bifunctional hydroxymethylpyrimidine kinase/phosphomethylpyrimidine kinase [Lachnospiraceae bacterium]